MSSHPELSPRSGLCRLLFLVFALPILVVRLVDAQPWRPAGGNVVVPSDTAASQIDPAVARSADGISLVAWTDVATTPEGTTLVVDARAFASGGVPLGADLAASALPGAYPAVAASSAGEFLLVWHGLAAADATDTDIFARRLDAAGQPLGAAFQLNVTTVGDQLFPRVAPSPGGAFLVVWKSVDEAGEEVALHARRVDAAGQPLGAEFGIESSADRFEDRPDLAVASDGGFLVAWESRSGPGSDGAVAAVHARLFDANGTALGAEFQVDTQSVGDALVPEVAALADGKFAVTWYTVDGAFSEAKAQLLRDTGDLFGPELTVANGDRDPAEPAVTATSDGFLVSWDGDSDDQSRRLVWARAYDLAGEPLGGEFQVSYLAGPHQVPALAADDRDDVLVVWQGVGSPGGVPTADVLGQRLVRVLFADGFESGDAGAWSATVSGAE